MRWAMYTARIPNTRLTPMYVSATPEAPFIIRLCFSSAKEENVVKPPQIPTFRKSTVRGFKASRDASARYQAFNH